MGDTLQNHATAMSPRLAADCTVRHAHRRTASHLIDAPTLFAGCGGDSVLLDKMVNLFAAQLPGHMAEVDRAIRGRNPASLRSASHKLCGLSAMFSASASDLVRAMEGHGIAHDWCSTARTYGDVQVTLEALRRSLDGCTIDDLRELTAAPHPDRLIAQWTSLPVR